MSGQVQLFNDLLGGGNPADVVYTPRHIAKQIVDYFAPNGICLDPCRGDGAFFDCMPIGSEWCELTQAHDFFDWVKPVDWIISNPPYSIYRKWLEHSFSIASNIVYLIPITKAFASYGLIQKTVAYGGIKSMLIFGSGRKVCPGFDYGYAVAAVHYQRGYSDSSIKLEYADQVLGIEGSTA